MSSNNNAYVGSSNSNGPEYRIQITNDDFELYVVHSAPLTLEKQKYRDLSYLVYVPKYIECEMINWNSLTNIKGSNMSISSYVFPNPTVDEFPLLDQNKLALEDAANATAGKFGVLEVLLFKPMNVITGTVINIKIRLANNSDKDQVFNLLASFRGNMTSKINTSKFQINGELSIDEPKAIPALAAVVNEDAVTIQGDLPVVRKPASGDSTTGIVSTKWYISPVATPLVDNATGYDSEEDALKAANNGLSTPKYTQMAATSSFSQLNNNKWYIGPASTLDITYPVSGSLKYEGYASIKAAIAGNAADELNKAITARNAAKLVAAKEARLTAQQLETAGWV